MNLIVLSFWNIVVLAFGALLIIGIFQMSWWLAGVSVRLIHVLTHAGLHKVAKFVLATMVNYDRRTYCKNRLIYWNQVGIRFALLWGFVFFLTSILMILRIGNKVDSIGHPLLIIAVAYLGFRSLMYWFSQDVNEQSLQPHQPNLIRRWDYLDELFAESA